MAKKFSDNVKCFLFIFLTLFCTHLYGENDPKKELDNLYFQASNQRSDIYEHVPVLRNLSQECSSVIEIGVRSMVSTWGLLLGLSECNSPHPYYLGIDISPPPPNSLAAAKRVSAGVGIDFDFWVEDDMTIQIPFTELLFIDSLHTYCHLTYELENFSPYVSKYIVMHDTSPPWENVDDSSYFGDYSEYPESYNRKKRGLWAAVEDFLAKNPDWVLHKRLRNNHGLTILKRINVDATQDCATLQDKYEQSCKTSGTRVETLSLLAKDCSSIIEIGMGSMQSTWGLLKGLSESRGLPVNYLGIDVDPPSVSQELDIAKRISKENGINFTFWNVNDLHIQTEYTDLLVLDTLQTYCHVTFELEHFANNVSKYIWVSHSSQTEELTNDPFYKGDYSEYTNSYDKTKTGVLTAVYDFLGKHSEWNILKHQSGERGYTVIKRSDDFPISQPLTDPLVEEYLNHKIILCTGPALRNYEKLKRHTEADLNIIPFKKIFLTTNDPNILNITFNGKKPDSCQLLVEWGKQLDCLNCIITTLQAAINDPEVLDDDILMFKHETVFINDLGLFKRVIKKMIDGSNLIVRTGMFGPCTDHFFVKVSAVRKILQSYPLVEKIPYSCEDYFKALVVNQIQKVYNLPLNHSLWLFTEFGSYHIYPGYGQFNADQDGWNRPFWNKENYDQLFK